MTGFGFVYLFFLSIFLAVPTSYKIYTMIESYRGVNLPNLVMQLPKCYISEEGLLTPYEEGMSYKEIRTAGGDLAILFNIEDQKYDSSLKPKVELNSRSLTINAPSQSTVMYYTDIVPVQSNFDPPAIAGSIDAFLNVGMAVIAVFMALWFYFVLLFNSFVMGLICKLMFVLVGKIKTSFFNTVRLCAYANTIVGVIMALEIILNIQLNFNYIMFLPLVYMLMFIRSFRQELEHYGVEAFVEKYTPKGTKIKNRGENSENKPARDISDFTDGLDSTTNKNRMNKEESSSAPESTPEDASAQEPHSESNASVKNDQDQNNKNSGSGYFAP